MPFTHSGCRPPSVTLRAVTATYPDRKRMRLPSWDYRNPAAYFITICTFGRRCSFENPRITGVLRTTWNRVACRGGMAPPHEFVVMPNHVHGILWLPGNRDDRPHATARRARHAGERIPFDIQAVERKQAMHDGRGASPLRPRGAAPGSVGAILGSFKSTSSRRINLLHGTPGPPVWQRDYYDRVIRDDKELDAFRRYILDNPAKWDLDHNNPRNWQ